MKRSALRGTAWRAPPSFEELFGITESGKGWVAVFIVVLVLAALVLGFFYSTSPTMVHVPTR